MLLDDVKVFLRISHNKLDSDLEQHIQSALDELRRVGVAVPDNVDSYPPQIVTAVKLYCAYSVDFLGKSEQYKNNFDKLKQALSLSDEYRGDSNAE